MWGSFSFASSLALLNLAMRQFDSLNRQKISLAKQGNRLLAGQEVRCLGEGPNCRSGWPGSEQDPAAGGGMGSVSSAEL